MANDINSLTNAPIRTGKVSDNKLVEDHQLQDKSAALMQQKQNSLNGTTDAVQLQRLQTAINNSPDVDLKKVSELKHAVDNGHYQINVSAIKTKIVELQMEDLNKK